MRLKYFPMSHLCFQQQLPVNQVASKVNYSTDLLYITNVQGNITACTLPSDTYNNRSTINVYVWDLLCVCVLLHVYFWVGVVCVRLFTCLHVRRYIDILSLIEE